MSLNQLFIRIKRIKTKFLIQYGILIVLSLFIASAMILSLNKIDKTTNYKSENQNLVLGLYKLRKLENDFVSNDLIDIKTFEQSNSLNIISFNKELELNSQRLNFLINEVDEIDHSILDSLHKLKKELANYNLFFNLFKDLSFERGFKDWGLEGKLRESIHKIEKGSAPFDKVLMLTLRRSEKDYFLRKDLEYVDKFDKSFKEFRATIKDPHLATLSSNYYSDFHKLVDIEKRIGLNINQGVKANLCASFLKSDSLVKSINQLLVSKTDDIIRGTYVKLFVLLFLQFIIAVVLAIGFSNITSKSVSTIEERITTLSQGSFPEPIEVVGVDELAVTSLSFNNLLDRIIVASNFAQKIGEGDLSNEYDEKYANDVLGRSLKTMHLKLIEVSKENEQRNWINEGLAKFVDLMRDTENIERFYNNILSNIIRYIGANQGYLYVLNTDDQNDPVLEIKGVYAYGKQRYLEEKKEVRFQQGLVGQAWFDKDSLFFTEIPADYVNITSGMGEATPKCISIVPLIANEEVVGMLEIASFAVLEKFKVEFVEKLAETIAITISSVKTNENTLKLLEQSQLLTADLREQEEEIRQNMEEMNATQEEMERKERELMRRMKEMEDQLKVYKEQSVLS
jgi:hypothetical protein